jgi:RNA polymerase-binding transcription factor DksA
VVLTVGSFPDPEVAMAEAARKAAASKKAVPGKKGGAPAPPSKTKKAKKPAGKTPAAKGGAGKKRSPKVPAKPAKKAATKATKATKKPAPTKRPVPKKPTALKAPPAKQKAVAVPEAKKPPAEKAPAAKKAQPEKAPPEKAPAAKKAPTLPPPKQVPPRKPGSVICPLSGWEVMPAKPNLSTRTLKRLRDKLIDERNQQLRQSEELAAEAEELAQERDPGDTQFDEESGEGDTVNVERERDLLLSASARHIVDAIDRALARMEAGTYGVCVPAGRRLSLERLEAIPYAEECVDCKARAERRR